MSKRVMSAMAVAVLVAASVSGDVKRPPDRDWRAYRDVVAKTVAMTGDRNARKLAADWGLKVLNVTWEDTGRYKNSAVGPNISDMTIQVQLMDPRTEQFSLHCMPVIRYPNFSDKTGDVSLDDFHLLVGNEKGRGLKRVTLREFLGDMRSYLSNGRSWKGRGRSLLAERDTHVLVSAQASFLPIPKRGKAEFNPVLFNYQSYEGDPAVLTILATREGTSVTVIDNKRDAFQAGRTWGQRLFFNQRGQRASLTGERLSDFEHRRDIRPSDGRAPVADSQEGLNVVLLIQVPLKQKKPMRFHGEEVLESLSYISKTTALRKSDVEAAVIGHGRVEGPFTEIDNLDIERDPRFPIRVTVQFYKATSNGAVDAADMAEIARQIKRVYDDADYVGSLVTAPDIGRPTEHDGPKTQPRGWWHSFWHRNKKNTGQSRGDALRMLRELRGHTWGQELARALKRIEQ